MLGPLDCRVQVDRIRRGAEQRKAKFVYVEQLRAYHSASDDSDDEAGTKAKHRKPHSPRKVGVQQRRQAL